MIVQQYYDTLRYMIVNGSIFMGWRLFFHSGAAASESEKLSKTMPSLVVSESHHGCTSRQVYTRPFAILVAVSMVVNLMTQITSSVWTKHMLYMWAISALFQSPEPYRLGQPWWTDGSFFAKNINSSLNDPPIPSPNQLQDAKATVTSHAMSTPAWQKMMTASPPLGKSSGELLATFQPCQILSVTVRWTKCCDWSWLGQLSSGHYRWW